MERRPRRFAAAEALRLLQLDDSFDEDVNLDDLPDDDQATVTASGDASPTRVEPVIFEDSYLQELPEENLVVLSDNEEESDDDSSITPNLVAPSGKRWNSLASEERRGRAPRRNILRARPGVHPGVKPSTNRESFLLFMDPLIDDAVRFTNLEARRVITEYNRAYNKQKKWIKVDRDEMEAFIGLHVIGGALKANHRSTESLWSERDGPPVFRATMSRERFLTIKRFFRVDDRQRRDPNDPLSPVRVVWQQFVDKLQQFFVPNADLTLDEQLLEFHGRVKFRVYMKSKPAKYGIKIVWLCDSETAFALNGVPYIGETTLTAAEKENMSISEAISMKTMRPYLNKGHSVTADNWFTTPSLATNLADHDTSLVGTVRSNNRDLPPKAKTTAGRRKKSTEYFKSGNQILLSFWDKGTKPVLLLSTLHTTVDVDSIDLPEIVQHYNATKSGVDAMDRMVRYYTCKRKCFRWTYGFFCNMIDIALLNASIIMRKSDPPSNEHSNKFRYNFLTQVAYELVDKHLNHRLSTSRLTKPVSTAMSLIGLQTTCERSSVSCDSRRSGRCKSCRREKDRKTTQRCSACGAFVCILHCSKSVLCFDCV